LWKVWLVFLVCLAFPRRDCSLIAPKTGPDSRLKANG
jgi:hypothetical protein